MKDLFFADLKNYNIWPKLGKDPFCMFWWQKGTVDINKIINVVNASGPNFYSDELFIWKYKIFLHARVKIYTKNFILFTGN
jgi:hypothetical protein